MPKKGELKKGASKDSIRQRKYNSSEKQKTRRAERNAARRIMEKKGKAHKGDGLDVDHRSHNTKDKSAKNLSMMPKGKNRAMNQYDKRKKKK